MMIQPMARRNRVRELGHQAGLRRLIPPGLGRGGWASAIKEGHSRTPPVMWCRHGQRGQHEGALQSGTAVRQLIDSGCDLVIGSRFPSRGRHRWPQQPTDPPFHLRPMDGRPPLSMPRYSPV